MHRVPSRCTCVREDEIYLIRRAKRRVRIVGSTSVGCVGIGHAEQWHPDSDDERQLCDELRAMWLRALHARALAKGIGEANVDEADPYLTMYGPEVVSI